MARYNSGKSPKARKMDPNNQFSSLAEMLEEEQEEEPKYFSKHHHNSSLLLTILFTDKTEINSEKKCKIAGQESSNLPSMEDPSEETAKLNEEEETGAPSSAIDNLE